ncbi:MAG: hypothetical protein JW870_11255 [Candidatus Delongbacteria bacterium]|nr:hypothetical protein [Candidatus Delongbacteria bacterium]
MRKHTKSILSYVIVIIVLIFVHNYIKLEMFSRFCNMVINANEKFINLGYLYIGSEIILTIIVLIFLVKLLGYLKKIKGLLKNYSVTNSEETDRSHSKKIEFAHDKNILSALESILNQNEKLKFYFEKIVTKLNVTETNVQEITEPRNQTPKEEFLSHIEIYFYNEYGKISKQLNLFENSIGKEGVVNLVKNLSTIFSLKDLKKLQMVELTAKLTDYLKQYQYDLIYYFPGDKYNPQKVRKIKILSNEMKVHSLLMWGVVKDNEVLLKAEIYAG